MQLYDLAPADFSLRVPHQSSSLIISNSVWMLWPASGRLPWHENNMSYLEENYCHENCIHRHKKYMPVHSRQKTKNSFSVQTHSQSELIQCPNSFSVRTLSVSELFQYLNSFSLWTRGCMGGGWVHVVIRKGHVAPKAPSISDWKIASKERKYFHYMNEFILWKNIKTKLVAWPNMRLKIICFVHLNIYHANCNTFLSGTT